ncbi:MAG: transposase [Verrucomicrobiales bacterium]|jgi:transposase|nr:transposase [Verrucomicrobiales bacterium]
MTKPLHQVDVGVEVASAKLDLAISNNITRSGLPPQVLNHPTAITRWLRTLPPAVHLVCESTGPYHLALLRTYWQRGVTVSRVNPEQVRAFARSRRQFAKTDRLDAKLLADFAGALAPPPTRAPEPMREQLRELHTRRAQLVAVRADELKRQEQPSLGKVATASLRRSLAFLTREITTRPDLPPTHRQPRRIGALCLSQRPVQGASPHPRRPPGRAPSPLHGGALRHAL